jgi:hypothetical protein
MITLRDIDNRGDDGAPYEFTGTAEQIIGYLDGPLRRDLRDDSALDIEGAIAAIRRDDLITANGILNRGAAVHLSGSPT